MFAVQHAPYTRFLHYQPGRNTMYQTLIKIFRQILLVSKIFTGFPSLGVKNGFLFKVRLLVLSNSVLPEREIQENVLLTSRICLEYFHQWSQRELLGAYSPNIYAVKLNMLLKKMSVDRINVKFMHATPTLMQDKKLWRCQKLASI